MKILSLTAALALVAPTLATTFLWPIPRTLKTGKTDILLDSDFEIYGPDSDYLQDAIDRYTQIITSERWIPVQAPFPNNGTHHKTTSTTALESLEIKVDDLDQPLEYGVDESYKLHIPVNKESATLEANTIWGAIRGLETFSQLIQARPKKDEEGRDLIYDDNDEDEQEDNHNEDFDGLIIPDAPIKIEDAPLFPHRGLMLDTARNYFPIFHWHLTDSQSFPLKLKNTPELAEEGAYRLHQRRLIYSPRDVKKVVAYAYKRGVRVIPEIDMPAHTGSWALSHKELITCHGIHYMDPSNEWEKRYAAEPGTGQLNPVRDETYELVNKVIDEVASMFPDSWYHGGGDEPVYNCWEKDASVRDYMQKNNVTGPDLLNTFLQREIDMINKLNKTTVIWEDPATTDKLPISKDVVLQVWTHPIRTAIKQGYKVIASDANFWYLDCGHSGWETNDDSYDEQIKPETPEKVVELFDELGLDADGQFVTQNFGGGGGDWCSPFKSWQRIYSYDLTFNLTDSEAKNVLGGEVALWAEQTDDASLDMRLWPRASAAGEVLWSGRYSDEDRKLKRDLSDAGFRLFDWRYRMLKRGIKAEALQPLWCASNPHLCDMSYPEVFKTM
ncbi:glycoside hydrolase superfamily [Mycotypha africana]|uniref:glycoside hydrolase superfamily n=1 Tax=Mycotypha africana TaxID=64632 RepID=UPI0022FFDD45|nr:glycoside hydrolase superfamily [Mycotypha africana]KAI8977369.1 glycoside hydrolase superfamily [Mycotypha africana]